MTCFSWRLKSAAINNIDKITLFRRDIVLNDA